MRVLSIVHQEDCGPGVFADALGAADIELTTWLPAQEPNPPGDPDGPPEFDAIFSFGGEVNPDQEAEHPWIRAEKRLLAGAVRVKVPLFGICLGAELIADAVGSPSREALAPEIGWYEVELRAAGAGDPVLGALPDRFEALTWHSYEVVLPACATELARSEDCLQAYRIGDHAWAIQFHAEVTLDDFHRWVARASGSELAVRLGVDPERLAELTRARIHDWNALGRGICDRFLTVARTRAAGASLAG